MTSIISGHCGVGKTLNLSFHTEPPGGSLQLRRGLEFKIDKQINGGMDEYTNPFRYL